MEKKKMNQHRTKTLNHENSTAAFLKRNIFLMLQFALGITIILYTLSVVAAGAQNLPSASANANETPRQVNLLTTRFQTANPINLQPGATLDQAKTAAFFDDLKKQPGFRFLDGANPTRSGLLSLGQEAAISLDAPPFASLGPAPDLHYPGETLTLTANWREPNLVAADLRFEKDAGVAEVKNENKRDLRTSITIKTGETVFFGGKSADGKYVYLALRFEVAGEKTSN
jgi:hypothetical protein